jgi:ribosomal protein L40E
LNRKNKHKPPVEFEPEKQTQAKQAVLVLVLDSVLELESSGSSTAAASDGEVVLKKQPKTTITEFLTDCTKAGFSLDRKLAEKILSGNPIDPTWLPKPFSFVEFIASVIAERYCGKPPAEQKRLFISAFSWRDLQEEYPAWREKREQEVRVEQQQEEAEARKRSIAEARRNRPAICGHCGAALAPESRACPSCGRVLRFDEEAAVWEFDEPLNFDSIREIFKSKAGGAGS